MNDDTWIWLFAFVLVLVLLTDFSVDAINFLLGVDAWLLLFLFFAALLI